LIAVRSKVGEITPERVDDVADMLCKDALAEFQADCEKEWHLLPTKQHAEILLATYYQSMEFVHKWVAANEIEQKKKKTKKKKNKKQKKTTPFVQM
jgi:hypothetical protein